MIFKGQNQWQCLFRRSFTYGLVSFCHSYVLLRTIWHHLVIYHIEYIVIVRIYSTSTVVVGMISMITTTHLVTKCHWIMCLRSSRSCHLTLFSSLPMAPVTWHTHSSSQEWVTSSSEDRGINTLISPATTRMLNWFSIKSFDIELKWLYYQFLWSNGQWRKRLDSPCNQFYINHLNTFGIELQRIVI